MATKTEKKSRQKKKQRRNGSAGTSAGGPTIDARTALDDWRAYTKRLGKRVKKIVPFTSVVSGKQSIHLWGFAKNSLSPGTLLVAGQCHRLLGGKSISKKSKLLSELESLAATSGEENLTADFAVQILSVCAAFPKLAARLPESISKSLFQQMNDLMGGGSTADLDKDPLVAQLLHAELPIVMSVTFADIKSFPELMDDGIQNLRQAFEEVLDGNGMLHASYLASLQPLTACWVRCRAICRASGTKMLVGKSRELFSHTIEQAFRFMRVDGTPVFADKETAVFPAELFATALKVDESKDNPKIARTVLGSLTPARKSGKPKRRAVLPEAADHSEWAEVAVLQVDWQPDAPKLVVDWNEGQTRIELNCGRTILTGTWGIELEVDGHQVKQESDWTVVCWHSDDDVDFIELESMFEGGVTVQRQLMLARDDRFLMLADAVIGKGNDHCKYKTTIPVDTAITWHDAQETFEGFLSARKRIASVIPMSLPEWKSGFSAGGLKFADGMLTLQNEFEKSGYFPLMIDLDPKRVRKPLTWRPLTVAESLRIVSPSEAAGFRVQAGDDQWMFFRSLTEPRSRTLLGQNLYNEFYVGQFDPDGGEVTEMVSIE